MIVKFGAAAAVVAIVIATGVQPADARGTMSLHDGWNAAAHEEVLPAAYTPAPAQQTMTLRRALAQKRHLRD